MATRKPGTSSRLALDVKRVNEAARRAEDQPADLVRRVVDALPVLIAHIDLEQRYTFANAAYARWFDTAPGSLPGRLVHELLDPAAYETARPYMERALAGEAVTFQNTLELPGGARREVLAHLVPDSRDGRLQGVSAVISDVTAQKRAEADAGRLAAIVEASADAIVSATLDGVFTSWNASAEKLFGYTSAEALGAPITIILPEDLVGARQDVVERLRRGERVEHADSERLTKDGRRIPVSVGFAGIRNERGELVEIAASARDISARQRIEQQLQARVRQQEAVAALGRTALAGVGLCSTIQGAVSLVAETLEVEFVKVLELAGGGRELVLRAACGWPEAELDRSVPADALTQAGYTLAAGRPTVVIDLARETRFRGTRWLQVAGGVSGMSVIIAGEEGHAYGVLEAHSSRRREFTTDDVHFLEAVANVLAGAIQRTRAEEQQALLLAELSHRVKNTLAVVQSLAVLTGERAGSFPAFLAAFAAGSARSRPPTACSRRLTGGAPAWSSWPGPRSRRTWAAIASASSWGM